MTQMWFDLFMFHVLIITTILAIYYVFWGDKQ